MNVQTLSEPIKRHPRIIAGVIVLVISLIVFWYTRPSPSQKLLARLSKHILIPKGESPAIATVSDKTQLGQQSFFTEAQNGDILFVFNQSKKAILYRPSIDRVVNVTSVNINSNINAAPATSPQAEGSTETPTTSPEEEIKASAFRVAIYNGTTRVGLASRIENTIKENLPNIKVITKVNAKVQTYTDHVVIDISGNHQKEAEYIAGMLQTKTASLPEGEQKPNTDILVIAGKEIQ